MKPVIQKGKLITWKDDRGFGFIKPDDGGKEVFLHISTVKGVGRRPKVGDTILYEQIAESDGRIRTARASIQGVASQRLATKTKTSKGSLIETVVGVVILAAVALLIMQFDHSRSPSLITSITQPGCVIKGNISYETGNKLYHLPGMEDYESTVIAPAKGEKWFCTESDAIENGWKKAPK